MSSGWVGINERRVYEPVSVAIKEQEDMSTSSSHSTETSSLEGAWEKFKEKHGVLPNILEFEPAILKNPKIHISIQDTVNVPSNLSEDEIASIFRKEIAKKNLPIKVSKGE